MAKYTLTYSNTVEGWPSFYSYEPESMVGMNNYFYSFKNAQLYRHNTSTFYNNYYGDNYDSVMRTVINEAPLDNKLFKTLSLESTHPWEAEAISDTLNQTIKTEEGSYVQKENDWFSYLRNNGYQGPGAGATVLIPTTADYKSRVNGGIGLCDNVDSTVATDVKINFPSTMSPIGNVVSDGDWCLYASLSDSAATVCGRIKNINYNPTTGVPSLTIDSTVVTPTLTPPVAGDFIIFMKDSVAESDGILGHYVDLTLTLTTTYSDKPSELFAVETQVMKSFP